MGLGFWALYRAASVPVDAAGGDPARPRPLHPVPPGRAYYRHARLARPVRTRERLRGGTAQILGPARRCSGALQAVLLLIVWIHGCLGVHFWLRLKPFYPRAQNVLLSVAVLLPALALLGYYQGGERNAAIGRGPGLARASHDAGPRRDRSPERRSARLIATARSPFWPRRLPLRLLARGLRRWRERRVGLDQTDLSRPHDSRAARIERAGSEPSQQHPACACLRRARSLLHLPHPHPRRHRAQLPAASAAERAVLERIGAGAGVRLACQLAPDHDIAFVPLLPPACDDRGRLSNGAAVARETNAMSSSCSSTCADRAGSPKGACPTTPCSSSTSSSTR